MSTDKKVLNYMMSKIESGFDIKNPSHFSLICKNKCGLKAQAQGAEVEKYLENSTGFERIAEDGVAIEQVGHKGDLRVLYNNKEYFPNVKSTMTNNGLWLKSNPNQMGIKSIKVFDSSWNSGGFSLSKKLKQIGNNLIIIHFAWDAKLFRGAVSVTSLKEMAQYFECRVIDLLEHNGGKGGHYKIKSRELYETACYHERVRYFGVSEKEASDYLKEKEGFSIPSIVDLMGEN